MSLEDGEGGETLMMTSSVRLPCFAAAAAAATVPVAAACLCVRLSGFGTGRAAEILQPFLAAISNFFEKRRLRCAELSCGDPASVKELCLLAAISPNHSNWRWHSAFSRIFAVFWSRVEVGRFLHVLRLYSFDFPEWM